MNPLTLVKRIQQINSKEAALGISESASWHAKYKDSAYVFVGGIPFDLTEGDLLAVFAQYGEIVDVNLVRDKGTGKSKGFAFIAYEDQRSTNLAVDNLNGAQILGRTVRVDHVTNYKKKEEEDEEEEQRKREERGVCRAFQRGECTRGAGCRFSHDEHRASNTGWGPEDQRNARWGHDKYYGPTKSSRQPGLSEGPRVRDDKGVRRTADREARGSSLKNEEESMERDRKQKVSYQRDHENGEHQKQAEWRDREIGLKDDGGRPESVNRLEKRDAYGTSIDDDRRKERLSTRDSERHHEDDQDKRGAKRSKSDRDGSSRHSDRDEHRRSRSDR